MIAYLFIFFGALLRLAPHPANFTPIAAIALFSGYYLSRRDAVVVPLVAMALSDYFIGFDSWSSRLVVYSTLAVVGVLGYAIRTYRKPSLVVGVSIAGSVIFYVVTNLVWLYPPTMYSHDLAGQMSSYINALPFFRNTLLGDLFYTGALFGSYELVQRFAHAHSSRQRHKDAEASIVR
jgi:hypothetical protein